MQQFPHNFIHSTEGERKGETVSERERFTNIHTRLCVRLITWLTSTNYLRQVCVCVWVSLPVCLCEWVCACANLTLSLWPSNYYAPVTHTRTLTHSHAHSHPHTPTSLDDRTHIRWPVHMTEPAACAGRIRRWLIRSNLQSLRGGDSAACLRSCDALRE